MEINGLPLHPLVVHAAVVFGPLSAVTALAYVGLPKYRDRLRWVTVVVVAIALVTIWAAFLTGEDFRESKDFFNDGGAIADKVDKHEDLAETLRLMVSGFAVVTFLQAWLHGRTGAVRILLGVLVAVGAILTLIWTALTGDAGAQAVWGS